MIKINSSVSYLETEQINSKSKNTHQTAYDIAKTNSLERTPQSDRLEKKNKTGRNIALGSLAVLAVAAGIEIFKFHGKHIDDLVAKVKKKWGSKSGKPEPPKAPEAKKPEIIEIEGQKVRVEKPEAPKLLHSIDKSQYPKKYVQDGFEVEEKLRTSSSSGDEYISKEFYQNGNLVKEECSQHGSTTKSYEYLYKDGVEEKVIYYKEDGVTKSWEQIYDSNGKEIETRHYDEKGLNIIRVKKAEPPKLLQGIDKSQYPKKYVQDGFEVEEKLRTSSSSGDEYIFKEFYQNGNLVKEEYSQSGSTLKESELLYKDGVKEKIIYYKEDGVTKWFEKIYDSNGKEIEIRHYD